jgi:hypothetical protein
MLQILKYEPVSKGVCIGYVDVKIDTWGIIVRRIAHLEKGEKRWFNFPQFSMPGADLKPKYVRYVDFDKAELNTRFFDALKKAVAAYLEKPVSPAEMGDLFNGEIKNEEPLPPPPWEKEMF